MAEILREPFEYDDESGGVSWNAAPHVSTPRLNLEVSRPLPGMTRAMRALPGWRSVVTDRGQLRVYLGAAQGVGKTYAMLGEARRRAGRGTGVVVGYVETHGRARTAVLLEGLEVMPRKTMTYRGSAFTELDVDAVIARRLQVVLIDELAHTNIPGSRNNKRWQDIQEILDAGITVISNVNIQHLESLNDVVQQITGVAQRETVPDEVVRCADQVELVDMAPEALRRRMAHGNIYLPEKIDAALANYFRVGNLTALRELALLWVTGKVDEQLERYRADHGIAGTWEARERVVVTLSGGPEGDTLIRRAARIAARTKGADPALLERILANLATNALRYSPAGEHVLLTASGYNDRIDLRIADRGPGIPPAERDRVFRLFQRLGDRTATPALILVLLWPAGRREVGSAPIPWAERTRSVACAG